MAKGKAASDQACIFFVIVLLRLGDMNLCIKRHVQDIAESVMSGGQNTCPKWPIRLTLPAIHKTNMPHHPYEAIRHLISEKGDARLQIKQMFDKKYAVNEVLST